MDRRQTFEIFTTIILSGGATPGDPELRPLLLEVNRSPKNVLFWS